MRLKLLDGNCIEKSQHRIEELRFISSGPLPGKSLVVYDPVLRLPIDVFPCEDGHAQERSLLKTVLLTIEKSMFGLLIAIFVRLTSPVALRTGMHFLLSENIKIIHFS
ncbi:MAG: hypothetical protein SRB1_01837 [Desulfobacteraceae bacterium Eth-SRB1]|nr:MAG: hypothetical protein SRB1_01837 [Desulfobacteraceae bacterium Eth-SRB1]